MQLVDYLASKRITSAEFAEQVGVDRSTVGRWLSGESIPRRDAIIKIACETGGQVTANDFMGGASDLSMEGAEVRS
ncbi:MAG: helix-turn-helix domain-containing protein [Hyphomicrobiaceae bacterium]